MQSSASVQVRIEDKDWLRFLRGPDPVVMTRDELYARVWNTPMGRLAKEFRVSDRDLRKACEQHDIPTPTAGYWTSLRAGKSPRKPRLRPPKAPDRTMVHIYPMRESDPKPPRPYPGSFFDHELSELAALEKHRSNYYPKSLGELHRIVERTRLSLNQLHPRQAMAGDPMITTMDYKGRWCFDIAVSPPCIERAVLLLQAIVVGIEQRGYRIREREHEEDRGMIEAHGCLFKLTIIERTERVLRDMSRHESYAHPYDYPATGRIEVVIAGLHPENTKIVRHEAESPEKQLAGVFRAVLRLADDRLWKSAERQQREDRRAAKELRERQEAERMRLEEEQRKQEQAKLRELLTEVRRWDQANRLRAYIAETRELLSKDPTLQGDSVLIARLEWAEGVAAQLDPLSALQR